MSTILTVRILKAILDKASEEELDMEVWADCGGYDPYPCPVTVSELEVRIDGRTGKPFMLFFQGDVCATYESKVNFYGGVKNAKEF